MRDEVKHGKCMQRMSMYNVYDNQHTIGLFTECM